MGHTSSDPWGHKITVVAYANARDWSQDEVETAMQEAADVLGRLPGIDFVGVSVGDVQDEPRDQVAS